MKPQKPFLCIPCRFGVWFNVPVSHGLVRTRWTGGELVILSGSRFGAWSRRLWARVAGSGGTSHDVWLKYTKLASPSLGGSLAHHVIDKIGPQGNLAPQKLSTSPCDHALRGSVTEIKVSQKSVIVLHNLDPLDSMCIQ